MINADIFARTLSPPLENKKNVMYFFGLLLCFTASISFFNSPLPILESRNTLSQNCYILFALYV